MSVTFRAEQELIARLKRLAADADRTVSAEIRVAVREHVDRHEGER